MLRKVLREALDERGLSARQAAKEIGVAHSTIARILTGEVTPSFETISAIADWLGTPAEAFVLIGAEGKENLAASLMIFLTRYPEIGDELKKVIDAYADGEIGEDDVKEIIRYIQYRLS